MKIKILFIYSAAVYGGMIKNLNLILSNIDPARFETTLLIIESKNKAIQLKIAENVKIIYLNHDSKFSLKKVFELIKIVNQINPKIVSSHGYKAVIYTALSSFFIRPAKLISVIHGWTGQGWKLRFYYLMERLAYLAYDRIVALSEEQINYFKGKFLSPRGLIKIPNGIDVDAFDRHLAESKTYPHADNLAIIGTCLRLEPEKDHLTLLRAIAQIDPQRYQLWILGEGSFRQKLEDFCQQHNLSRNVVFFGHQHDLFPFYRAIDLYVSTSRQEGMPNNLLEAMAAGLPIVASNLPVHQELIENQKTGLIFEQGDSQQLQDYFVKFFQDPLSFKQLGEAGKERVINYFSLKQRIRMMENLYQNLGAC